jgi:hypothetical protein
MHRRPSRSIGALRLLALPLLLWAVETRAAEPAASPTDPTAQATDAAGQAPTELPDTQPASAPPSAEKPAKKASSTDYRKWHFAGIGYGFIGGAYGKTDVAGPLPPVQVDLRPRDTINALKFVVMGSAELRHDRLVFLGDLFWAHLGASKSIEVHDRNFISGSISSKTLWMTALGGYRVIDNGLTVDLLGGGRLNGANEVLTLNGPNRSATGQVKHKWIDPVIAARAVVPLGGKFSASAYGDIGGVLWGSKFSWQALGTLNYQISRKMRIGVGWRYYKVDYRTGPFWYDVALSGPLIAIRTDF